MSLENNNNGTEKKGLLAKAKSLIGTKEERRARGKSKNKKVKIIVAVVLIAAIAAGIGVPAYLKNKKNDEKPINTAVATIGRVRSAISASGTIQPKDQYEVVSSVRGDVLSDTFEVGDVIKKGDVLYELDKSDMSDTLEKAQMSMDKTKDSYQDTVDSINDLTVKAPITGVISSMYVSKGDSVSNGTKICDIIDKSKMILTIPFNTSDISYIGEGFSAEVTLQNSFYKTTGVVTRVSTGSLVNDLNVGISYVDIEVENPGGITVNDTATAVVNGIACNSAGTFDYAGKKTVTAKVSGDVATIYNDLGDQIYEGSTILQLESDTVNDNLKNANRSLREAQISLDNTYEQLEDYTISAKIDGTIIEKNIKAGDTLDNTNGNTTMCVIADMSVISFTIAVDELDVDKIELDQKVDITADALPNNSFVGHVNSININGSTSNGVTTYPVEVIVDNPEGLLPGMNVNAEIVIEEKNDILVVPVSAVMRGNVVYVKEEDAKAKGLKIISADNNQQNERPAKANADSGQSSENKEKENSENKAPESNGTEENRRPQGNQSAEGQRPQGQMTQGGQSSNNEAKQAQNGQTPDSEGNQQQQAGGQTGNNQSAQRGNSGNIRLGDIPEGFVAVRVETGINDDDYIEIVSGLAEDVTVYVKSTSTTTTQNMMGMPGGMGQMGGGMPGGMGGGMSGGARVQGGGNQNRQRN